MTLESDHHPDFTVTADKDSKSVWVNGPINCLGRFTPLGFEVNRKVEKVEDISPTGSIIVSIKNQTPKDWDSFKLLMKEHHGIDLDQYDNPLL
jgi:hypothetical protein